MTPIERLQTMLNSLGLKALEARLEALLEQAAKKETSYADFLDELLTCEVDARRSRYLRARLQLAHLPFVKTFDQFDFGFQPSIDERQIRELRTLRFVHEASNAIFLGPPDPETLCFTSSNSAEEILLFVRFPAVAAQPILHCRDGIPHLRTLKGTDRNLPRCTFDGLCSWKKLPFDQMAHASSAYSKSLSRLLQGKCLHTV